MRIEILVFAGFDALDVVAPWEVSARGEHPGACRRLRADSCRGGTPVGRMRDRQSAVEGHVAAVVPAA
jgi:hypothetical protein